MREKKITACAVMTIGYTAMTLLGDYCLRSNDGVVCSNGAVVCSNDAVVCSNDAVVCSNDGVICSNDGGFVAMMRGCVEIYPNTPIK
jgi:hypothetical protein